MKYILPIVLLLCAIACSVKGKNGVDGLSTKDCYPDRKSMENLNNVDVMVSEVGSELMLIPLQDDSQRYMACNLPKGYAVGDKLKVSLSLKEILPNERWAGTPCLLTSIEILK